MRIGVLRVLAARPRPVVLARAVPLRLSSGHSAGLTRDGGVPEVDFNKPSIANGFPEELLKRHGLRSLLAGEAFAQTPLTARFPRSGDLLARQERVAAWIGRPQVDGAVRHTEPVAESAYGAFAPRRSTVRTLRRRTRALSLAPLAIAPSASGGLTLSRGAPRAGMPAATRATRST
jgi:hypothetical protein